MTLSGTVPVTPARHGPGGRAQNRVVRLGRGRRLQRVRAAAPARARRARDLVVEPAGQAERLVVVGRVQEEGGRAALAQPVGDHLDPRLPALDGRRRRRRGRRSARSARRVDRLGPSGQSGLLAQPSRSASLVGAAANSTVVSKLIHSASRRASTSVSAATCAAGRAVRRRSAKNAGWRTSTPQRCRVGHAAEEPVERLHVAGAERGRQLHRQRPGPVAERLDQRQEVAHLGGHVAQAPLVGDGAGQLEHEPEVRRGRLRPGVDRGRARAARRRWCCPRPPCTRSRTPPASRRDRVPPGGTVPATPGAPTSGSPHAVPRAPMLRPLPGRSGPACPGCRQLAVRDWVGVRGQGDGRRVAGWNCRWRPDRRDRRDRVGTRSHGTRRAATALRGRRRRVGRGRQVDHRLRARRAAQQRRPRTAPPRWSATDSFLLSNEAARTARRRHGQGLPAELRLGRAASGSCPMPSPVRRCSRCRSTPTSPSTSCAGAQRMMATPEILIVEGLNLLQAPPTSPVDGDAAPGPLDLPGRAGRGDRGVVRRPLPGTQCGPSTLRRTASMRCSPTWTTPRSTSIAPLDLERDQRAEPARPHRADHGRGPTSWCTRRRTTRSSASSTGPAQRRHRGDGDDGAVHPVVVTRNEHAAARRATRGRSWTLPCSARRSPTTWSSCAGPTARGGRSSCSRSRRCR